VGISFPNKGYHESTENGRNHEENSGFGFFSRFSGQFSCFSRDSFLTSAEPANPGNQPKLSRSWETVETTKKQLFWLGFRIFYSFSVFL
jgi:hypothetical protein